MNELVVVAPAGGLPCIPDCSQMAAACSAPASGGIGVPGACDRGSHSASNDKLVDTDL
jgi:hypothetical protein